MKKSISLTIAGALISIISMCVGAGFTFLYLAKPIQDSMAQYSEFFLSWQSEALQDLRAGKHENALQYLEVVAANSIKSLSKHKDNGNNFLSTYDSVKAVRYLCANPPVIPGASTGRPPSISDECAALTKSLPPAQ